MNFISYIILYSDHNKQSNFENLINSLPKIQGNFFREFIFMDTSLSQDISKFQNIISRLPRTMIIKSKLVDLKNVLSLVNGNFVQFLSPLDQFSPYCTRSLLFYIDKYNMDAICAIKGRNLKNTEEITSCNMDFHNLSFFLEKGSLNCLLIKTSFLKDFKIFNYHNDPELTGSHSNSKLTQIQYIYEYILNEKFLFYNLLYFLAKNSDLMFLNNPLIEETDSNEKIRDLYILLKFYQLLLNQFPEDSSNIYKKIHGDLIKNMLLPSKALVNLFKFYFKKLSINEINLILIDYLEEIRKKII